MTDAGLGHFKDVAGLSILTLHGTKVTDAGLPALAECRKLTVLGLRDTKVTARGLADFQAAVPRCRVTYDGGVLEPIDVDRAAAEWVLSIGGSVWVNGDGQEVRAAPELPRNRFTLTVVNFHGSPQVTDAGLARLRHCPNLTRLYFEGAGRFTDAGLAHLAGLRSLTTLGLDRTAVTDPGLVHLRELPRLTEVILSGSRLTDAGLKHLHGCKGLASLHVSSTAVTAGGLADFHAAVPGCRVQHDGGVIEAIDVDRKAAEWVLSVGGMVRLNGGGVEFRDAAKLPPEQFTLTWVRLDKAAVTDASLAQLTAPAGLTYLSMNNPGVTDAGMTHVAGIRGLKTLSLNGTAVTDFGLARLHGCRSLRTLSIGGTRVTPAGIKAFLAAVPGCRVEPGGTQSIAPLDPERAVAEWVLSVGGAVRLDGRDRDLRAAAELPKERFALTAANLEGAPVTDADLTEFKECVRMESLSLAGTKVAGSGLNHLKDCKKLTTLSLARTLFPDNSTDRFRQLPLTTLDLSDTPVTDIGVRRLKECRTLTSLDVRRTRVSGVLLAELREALPGCRVLHDGGVQEPKK